MAKRLHRLAACLSAGHRSSPDTPPNPHPLALLLSPSLHPSIHNSSSTSFLPALASRSATTPTCFRLPSRPLPELSEADTQTPLFHSSAHPFIHLHPPLIAPCGNRVIGELGDTLVFSFFFPFILQSEGISVSFDLACLCFFPLMQVDIDDLMTQIHTHTHARARATHLSSPFRLLSPHTCTRTLPGDVREGWCRIASLHSASN